MRIYAFAEHGEVGTFLALELAESQQAALKQCQQFNPYCSYQFLGEMGQTEDCYAFLTRVCAEAAIPQHRNDYIRLNGLIERMN